MTSGLDNFTAELAAILGGEVQLGNPTQVIGPSDCVGGSRPFESSAVRIEFGGDGILIPYPTSALGDSEAAVFLHSGQQVVMPIIRLCRHTMEESDRVVAVEYLNLDQWLHDAIAVWQFPLSSKATDDSPQMSTVSDILRSSQISIRSQLAIVGRIVRYALFGIGSTDRYSLARAASIVLPTRSQWVRPVDGTALAIACAKRQVLTAGLASREGTFIPSSSIRAKKFRIIPSSINDFGIDPVHTPEGEGIRMTGRLGNAVSIRDRKLVVPDSCDIPLSPSTVQIPFAGHDDPRRLLMAANMQVQAIELDASEPPAVYCDPQTNVPPPPGLNLRTAYLAWQGFNHEDAWVISRTAAEKLAGRKPWTQTIAVATIEDPANALVKVGDSVSKGQRLVNRTICPAMLSASLPVWKEISSFEDHVCLEPEPDELAHEAGEVVTLEIVDLLNDAAEICNCLIPIELRSRYRQFIRITLQRPLPLAVGDKLANRHGHKGIVGAIVDDEDMPRCDGQTLEALIDPISVMNRSNWGQVYETVLGRQAADGNNRIVVGIAASESQRTVAESECRRQIEPPVSRKWLTQTVEAISGTQFVMRLPHIAAEKLSVASRVGSRHGMNKRSQRFGQRFGEMDSWALWAHGGMAEVSTLPRRTITASASRFFRLVSAAGYETTIASDAIVIRRFVLAGPMPSHFVAITPSQSSKLADAVDSVVEFDETTPAAIVFDPPIKTVRLPDEWKPPTKSTPQTSETTEVAWVPLIPMQDRRPIRWPSGEKSDRELTSLLRKIARWAYYYGTDRSSPSRRGQQTDPDKELRYAVQAYLQLTYGMAVGQRATGELSSKASSLRRHLMGKRIRPSVRATAAPAGTLGLGLDEVGVPLFIARALLDASIASEQEVASQLEERYFWLKRDPVLHRYGLVRVRAKLIDGDVIRLPASILGPLGADFDGDTVAMFAQLPSEPESSESCRPSRLAWGGSLRQAMFVPGKQFRFGLGILRQDPTHLERLQRALADVNAPTWDAAVSPEKAFDSWVHQTHQTNTQDIAWEILEQHSIEALATNPGMDLNLLPRDELAKLAMVQWSAAKRDVFDSTQPESWPALERVLFGTSLSIYHRGNDSKSDPMANVMIAAKESVGRFGGALRRLLYSAVSLSPSVVQDAQTLTEQATQRVLSVKAGKLPLKFAPFNRQLNTLMQGQELASSKDKDVDALLKQLEKVCQRLRAAMPSGEQDQPWRQWLRSPQKLAQLVRKGEISIPVDELRIRSWFTRKDS